jgi:DNA-binding NarL/FixJ family response regulator
MSSASISLSPSQPRGCGTTRSGAATHAADIDLVIVDGQHEASPGAWTLLGCPHEIRIIATAETIDEALRVATQQKPQVCVVSGSLSSSDWLGLAHRLRNLDPTPRLLIYGAADSRMICTAIIAEADGVLCRDGDPEELAEVVRRVAAGEKLFPYLQTIEKLELLDCVDDPDRAIVAMLLEETHPDDVAGTLGLSARTVRVRRQAILRRLDAGRTGSHARVCVIDRAPSSAPATRWVAPATCSNKGAFSPVSP